MVSVHVHVLNTNHCKEVTGCSFYLFLYSYYMYGGSFYLFFCILTIYVYEMYRSVLQRGGKWNESGFRPPLCTYRLNWARRTSWGWWDDWDDTVLQTQDSKFEPWRSEAEHATSRSRRLPTILTFTRGWGRNIFCFFQTAETGNRTPVGAKEMCIYWGHLRVVVPTYLTSIHPWPRIPLFCRPLLYFRAILLDL